LPGVGPKLANRLASLGITQLAHLQALSDRAALRRLGEDGPALVRRARGEDMRTVQPDRTTKPFTAQPRSAATCPKTVALERHLWRLTEKLAARLKEQGFAADGVVLKLKTAGFATRTRAHRLPGPTGLPDLLFAAARELLARETDGTAYRLIGIGA